MNSPLPLKCIFRGRLELGNERTYEKVKSHFINRVETMYRSDIFFSIEEDFREESFAIELPVATMQLPERSYRKSMDLLVELAQYSLAGRIKGWAIDSGKIISEDVIQPANQKDAVIYFQEGFGLSQAPGNEEAAIDMLTESINAFDRNPLAYDRRGFISYKLGKYQDAIIDFEKSIAIFQANPEPYYGLGRCYQVLENWPKAKENMAQAMKVGIPRESIYHTARLYFGIASYHLDQLDEAEKELTAFITRKYDTDDHNLKKMSLAYKYLGKVQMKNNQTQKALENFNIALSLGQNPDPNQSKKNENQVAALTDLINVVSKASKTSKTAKKASLKQSQLN